jgi:ABC-type sugar transport system substrate-binding protein
MTRRARRLALLAGLLAAVVLGCGGEHKRSDVDLRGVRLAAAIKGLDNPFFVTMRDGLVATARRENARLQVAAAPTGLHDTAGQASKLESLAGDHPRCYVVNPINQTNLVAALARVAKDAPIVNVDSVIDEDAAKALGVEITTYVGTDNRAGGRLGADAMAALVDRGARVAVITGISGDVVSGPRADVVLVDRLDDVVVREVGNAAPGFVVHGYPTSLKLGSHAPVDDDDLAVGEAPAQLLNNRHLRILHSKDAPVGKDRGDSARSGDSR